MRPGALRSAFVTNSNHILVNYQVISNLNRFRELNQRWVLSTHHNHQPIWQGFIFEFHCLLETFLVLKQFSATGSLLACRDTGRSEVLNPWSAEQSCIFLFFVHKYSFSWRRSSIHHSRATPSSWRCSKWSRNTSVCVAFGRNHRILC